MQHDLIYVHICEMTTIQCINTSTTSLSYLFLSFFLTIGPNDPLDQCKNLPLVEELRIFHPLLLMEHLTRHLPAPCQ